MPLVHLRRFRVALWTALLAVFVPIGLTISEIPAGGRLPWIRLTALTVIAATLIAALIRQRAFEVRVRSQAVADDAIRASEAKFSGILAIAADAIISVDESQRIVHFNHGAEEIFGYRAADAIGMHLDALLPPRTRAVHEAHMRKFAQGPEVARRMGERREIFGLRKNGEEFPAEASISKLNTLSGTLFTVVLRDVTDRKRAEEDERFLSAASAELGKSLDLDEALRVAADLPVPHLADACLIDVLMGEDTFRRVASTRQRVDLTSALNALAAVPLTTDSPSPVIDVIRRGRTHVVAALDEAWLEGNEEPALIGEWRRLGARSLLVVPLTAGSQTLGALTLIAVDDRLPSADRQALAEKYAMVAAGAVANARLYDIARRANRARDEVLGIVSHDLRNPISAIAMCARALEQTAPENEGQRRELLVTIRESTEWINRLIQDLLDVAVIESGKLSLQLREQEAAQLALQARHMFEVEAAGHEIKLDANVATNLPLVFADGARIVQVLGNLLRNAIKFTPNGGHISIGVAGRPGAGRVEFSVADSGPGIPEENQTRLFDRYWQSSNGARARGTGLGLSIAKGIVDAHGGEIWVRSTPGQGSTFTFAIPAAPSLSTTHADNQVR